MYQDYDYHDMAREVQENLAKIYAESFEDQESFDAGKSDETYGKIQAILKCPEMEKCHPFLYSLDMENVNETDTEKINKIYDLGVDRGIIVKEDSEEDKNIDGIIANECDDECSTDGICGSPSDSLTDQEMTTNKLEPVPMDNPDVKKPIYTILYSGMKEGDLKMGEFYSMASSTEGAKEDCISQLTGQGYSNVSIMAVEQTTPSYGEIATVSDEGVDDGGDVGIEDVYNEDDSEEFEKQETGDDSEENKETPDVENTEVKSDDSSEDIENAEDATENNDSKNEEPKEDKSENTEEKTDVEKVNDEKDDEKDADEGKEEQEKEDDKDSESEEQEKDDKKKLTAEEKGILKDEYSRIFKEVLKKTELEKSVQDMTLQERTDFYQKLAEKWTKNDPSEFMTDKEQEALNKAVVKAN